MKRVNHKTSTEDQGENLNNNEIKFGVEEQGTGCPHAHFQEPQERTYRAALFVCLERKSYVPKLHFRLYLVFGTQKKIEEQLKKIRKRFEEMVKKNRNKDYYWTLAPFQNHVADNDNYTMLVTSCGDNYALHVECDETKCHYQPEDPEKVSFSIQEIQEKSSGMNNSEETRLHSPHDHLPACFSFILLCRERSQDRTPTNFNIILTSTDESGSQLHTQEIKYAACVRTDSYLKQRHLPFH